MTGGETTVLCTICGFQRGNQISNPVLESIPPLITTFKRSVFSEGDLGTLCIKASLTYFLFKSQPQLTNENNVELTREKKIIFRKRIIKNKHKNLELLKNIHSPIHTPSPINP